MTNETTDSDAVAGAISTHQPAVAQPTSIEELRKKSKPKSIDEIAWPPDELGILHRFVQHNNAEDNLLLVGPPGIGKTSAARLIAAATGREDMTLQGNVVNSESRKAARDFASNPTALFGDGKVVIVDEADMLKNDQRAFYRGDSMKHAIHVFTANDRDKFDGSLLSRCQKIVFDRNSVEQMHAVMQAQLRRLREILDDDGSHDVDSGALQTIVTTADGDWRECWRLLEDFLAEGGPERLAKRLASENPELGNRESVDEVTAIAMLPPPISDEELAATTVALIEDLCRLYGRFLIVDDRAILIMALWVMHSALHDAATHSPILGLISPEPECGKSTALELVERSLTGAIRTEDFTKAALYDLANDGVPILLDEVGDKDIVESTALTKFLNAGIKRNASRRVTATALPSENWCAKALAKIGTIKTRSLESRTIMIRLQRALPDEEFEQFAPEHWRECEIIASRLQEWAASAEFVFQASHPVMPHSFKLRRADLYRGIFAIADMAGGQLSLDCRQAALFIEGPSMAAQKLKPQLLQDIREIRRASSLPGIFSVDLVKALKTIAHRPWGHLTEATLASELEPYEVGPGNVRLRGKQLKGYKWAEFDPVFARYVAVDGPIATDTGPTHATTERVAGGTAGTAGTAKSAVSGAGDAIEPTEGEDDRVA